MAKPELGIKRLCPNCAAKYYDLNRDPVLCPKCNAVFTTGIVAMRRPPKEEDEEEEAEADGVELVPLEEAVEDEAEVVAEEDEAGAAEDDVVVADVDDVLVDDEDDDEVSDVVRGADNEEEER